MVAIPKHLHEAKSEMDFLRQLDRELQELLRLDSRTIDHTQALIALKIRVNQRFVEVLEIEEESMVSTKTYDWQPIETASKDGREIVCWGPSFWRPCFLRWKTNVRIVHAHNIGQSSELAASYFGDPIESDDYELAEANGGPTHWFYIPDPPKDALAGVSSKDQEFIEIETRRVRARQQGWTGNNDYLCLSCRAEGKSIDDSTYLDWPARYDNGMPYCTRHAEKVNK